MKKIVIVVIVVAFVVLAFGLVASVCAEVEKADADYNVMQGVEAQEGTAQDEQLVSDLPAAVKTNPKDAEIFFNIGLTYARDEDRYDLAISHFDKAIEMDPRHALAYNNRGWVYMNKGYYEQAISDFDQAIELKSEYANAYYNRGIAHQRNGQPD
jgi:tetratricopeptide (TPR) repeat protein